MRTIDSKIRNWSLYSLRKSDGKYYVGLTAYKDPTKRIKQYGGSKGAWVNHGLRVEEVVEIRKIGKMPKARAEDLENDMTNEYITKYGKQNVRGGRMVRKGFLYLRTYNSGSNQAIIQTLGLALAILVIIFLCFYVILFS